MSWLEEILKFNSNHDSSGRFGVGGDDRENDKSVIRNWVEDNHNFSNTEIEQVIKNNPDCVYKGDAYRLLEFNKNTNPGDLKNKIMVNDNYQSFSKSYDFLQRTADDDFHKPENCVIVSCKISGLDVNVFCEKHGIQNPYPEQKEVIGKMKNYDIEYAFGDVKKFNSHHGKGGKFTSKHKEKKEHGEHEEEVEKSWVGAIFNTVLDEEEIAKFNPEHDEKGRFAAKGTGRGDSNDYRDSRGGVVSQKSKDLAAGVRAKAIAEEKQVSRDMDSIAKANGGSMEGLDYAVKGQHSLERKLREDSIEKNQGYEKSAGGIGDALRYTMVFDHGNYTKNVQNAIEGMKQAGYQPIDCKMKNYWGNGSSIYQGINSNWRTPSGQVMEMQFHTPDSFYTKETLNHKAYEDYRDKNVSKEAKGAAEKYMLDTQARVARPEGVDVIGKNVPGSTPYKAYWPKNEE